MSEPKGLLRKNYFRTFLFVVVFAAVIYLVVRNIGVFGNILKAVILLGVVVLVHELGHFIVAKLSGIKVEAFSIFMPPTLLGVRKTGDGLRFRILSRFFPKEDDESGEGRLSFTIGPKAKTGETEYRIGLIPFGGYNKMLGQDDTGPVKTSDDPRSYANKPIGVRMAVIAAGVLFNAISAVMVFMMVFLVGIKLSPAVVGGVVPNSPAARAGLKPGDEIIEVAGKRDGLDFSHIGLAAALSDRGEKVALKVKHEDGSKEDFAIAAERLRGGSMRAFGVWPPQSLTIAKVRDAEGLLKRTGLRPGDRIKSVNGRDVQTHWELAEIVENAFVPAITVLAERTDPVSREVELIESRIRLALNLKESGAKAKSELGHIYSIVPRLRIEAVDTAPGLKSGDIILAIGDIENPTYKEMRNVTEEYEDKELAIKVLRARADGTEKTLEVTIVPKRSKDNDRVVIGIGVVLDFEHPVVAKTVTVKDGLAAPAIPRGAAITAVNGARVSNFYDVAREIAQNVGRPFDSAQDRRITIDYRIDEKTAGDVALDVGDSKEFIPVKCTFAEFVPFKPLERLYKAAGPVDAVVMGYKKTVMFIAQTYATLKSLIAGHVSPKNLMGPVGIVTVGYQVAARRPFIYQLYLLGLISACIAVLNFLPLLPFDGGHIVFLLIEKIKGSAVNERVQAAILQTGWVLVGALILYVTFNDIMRIFRLLF